jgi:large subunit ribosomal protein L32
VLHSPSLFVAFFGPLGYTFKVMVNHMRHTRSQTRQRRSHHALAQAYASTCPDCGAPKVSHQVCTNCGKYKGRTIIDVQAIMAKKEKKLKERRKAEATS